MIKITATLGLSITPTPLVGMGGFNIRRGSLEISYWNTPVFNYWDAEVLPYWDVLLNSEGAIL